MFLLQVYSACPCEQVRRSTLEFRSLRSARKTFLSNSYYWSYCFLFVSHPGCDNVRLAGTSRCSGRVEVFYNDKWGTVCDDHWGLSNADVVCRELKCGTALAAKGGAFFGEGKEDIWLDDVQCLGNEQSIHKCAHRPYGSNNCGHGEDAGVICSGQSEFHASLCSLLIHLAISGLASLSLELLLNSVISGGKKTNKHILIFSVCINGL